MPTYVYECAKCGDEFEVWQAFTDESLKKHPECGGKVAKVIQPAGIVLKGSGFYKNDSRSGSKRATVPAGSSDSKSGSDGSSDSSSSSSDTKSDTGSSSGSGSSGSSDGKSGSGGSGSSSNGSGSSDTKSSNTKAPKTPSTSSST